MVKDAKNPGSDTEKRLSKAQQAKQAEAENYRAETEQAVAVIENARRRQHFQMANNPDAFVSVMAKGPVKLDINSILAEHEVAKARKNNDDYPCLTSAFLGVLAGLAISIAVMWVLRLNGVI